MVLSLQNTENLIKEIAGDDVVPLVRILKKGRRHISEFRLAEKLELTVNEVRNRLYRLSEYSLVNSIRKKDKKKGWYIYYWVFNRKQAQSLFLSLKKEQIKTLQERLDKAVNETYFVCNNEGLGLRFEEALEHKFKCPECGNLLIEADNVSFVAGIKGRIEKLEQDLVEVSSPKKRKKAS